MFIISVILILLSSYLLLSIICGKEKNSAGFLYLLLTAFAQIIISFEILSLFNQISSKSFILCNSVFFIFSIILFFINQNILYKFKFDKNEIICAIKQDKILKFLSICFIIFMIFQLITILFIPVQYGDALYYYLPRCTEWIQRGSLNHYTTADIRELIMPVNMDLLYCWKLLFTHSEKGIAFFSYISFIGLIYVMYNFLKELHFPVKSILWSIFIISSFALVDIEIYTPCADLFTGVLILSSIYLYYRALKYDNIKSLYFSSLGLAIGIGTKYTILSALPSIAIILFTISFLYKNKKRKKQIFTYLFFLLINIIIFASYNYILNFIHFSNPVSSLSQLEINKFRGGFQGWLSNIIKYSFVIFDTSGIKGLTLFNGFITYIQSLVLSLFNLTDTSYTSDYFGKYFYFNETMSIFNSGLGIIGLLAFLPSILKSLKRGLKHKTEQSILSASLGFSLIINLIIFSFVMVYTSLNIRYLLTFAVIAFPVCVYSYFQKKKLLKYLLTCFIFIYFVIIAPYAPIVKALEYMQQEPDEINVYNFIKNQDKKNIAIIIQNTKTPNYLIEKLRFEHYKLDKILLENIEEYDLSQYDYIITNKDASASTNIINFKDKIKYPNLYVSVCRYYDYKAEEITNINGNEPVIVICEIPCDYFKEKGFENVENTNVKTYTILRKTIN